MKRGLIITLIIGAVGGIAAFIYFKFMRDTDEIDSGPLAPAAVPSAETVSGGEQIKANTEWPLPDYAPFNTPTVPFDDRQIPFAGENGW
jgi:hypothetical protein